MSVIPEDYKDLLERPLFGHLATKRPDGNVQVEPMWYEYIDGELWFTTSNQRQKYRNVLANPQVAISVNDPDQPYRYLEVRGEVASIEPDPTGHFYDVLAKRYGVEMRGPVRDAEYRVILKVRPISTAHQ